MSPYGDIPSSHPAARVAGAAREDPGPSAGRIVRVVLCSASRAWTAALTSTSLAAPARRNVVKSVLRRERGLGRAKLRRVSSLPLSIERLPLPLLIQRLPIAPGAGRGRQRTSVTRAKIYPRDSLQADVSIPGFRPPNRPVHCSISPLPRAVCPLDIRPCPRDMLPLRLSM